MTTPVLPDTDTAYNNLFMGIHQRVFFQKCAAAGYNPRNQQEAQWMLEKAGQLRALEQAAETKSAGDTNNPYNRVDAAIDQLMVQYGLSDNVKQAQFQEQNLAIRQIAQDLAQDPTFYNSILSLKAAEAQDIQQQLATMQ